MSPHCSEPWASLAHKRQKQQGHSSLSHMLLSGAPARLKTDAQLPEQDLQAGRCAWKEEAQVTL